LHGVPSIGPAFRLENRPVILAKVMRIGYAFNNAED
jgi:hypothetical protein